jgi:hypothetical protein
VCFQSKLVRFKDETMPGITELSKETKLLFAELDEKQKRHAAALLSMIHGHGGQTLVAEVTGMNTRTIRRGCEELENGLTDSPIGRIRKPGAGRPSVKKNA